MESNSSELRSSELGGFPPQAKLGQGSKRAQQLSTESIWKYNGKIIL